MKFFRYHNKQICPVVVYADCEALIQPSNYTTSKSTIYQRQVPCSVAYKVVSAVHGLPDKPLVLYTSEYCIERFMNDMLSLENEIVERLFPDSYDLLDEDLTEHQKNREKLAAQAECVICKQAFSLESVGLMKFPLLDPITGKYKGAIDVKCHEARKRNFRIPIFFHNFKGYDSTLIIWGWPSTSKLKLILSDKEWRNTL